MSSHKIKTNSVNKANTIDHNAIFIQQLNHSMTNSKGTKGFIPFGKFNQHKSQQELNFHDSVNTVDTQRRTLNQKPLSKLQFSNNKRKSLMTVHESFGESMS
jgi:hypothetical protein